MTEQRLLPGWNYWNSAHRVKDKAHHEITFDPWWESVHEGSPVRSHLSESRALCSRWWPLPGQGGWTQWHRTGRHFSARWCWPPGPTPGCWEGCCSCWEPPKTSRPAENTNTDSQKDERENIPWVTWGLTSYGSEECWCLTSHNLIHETLLCRPR